MSASNPPQSASSFAQPTHALPPNTPSEPGSGATPQPAKRIACVICRRRKLKCDGARPSCGTCARLKHECAYEESVRRKSGPRRGYVKMLEERLAHVEGLLNSRDSPPSQPTAIDPPRDLAGLESESPTFEEGNYSIGSHSTFREATRLTLESDFNSLPKLKAFKSSIAPPSTQQQPQQPQQQQQVSPADGLEESQNPLFGCAQGGAQGPDDEFEKIYAFEAFTFNEDEQKQDGASNVFDLISLGMDEPLPPKQVTDELNELFFRGFNKSYPMLHKLRYMTSLNYPPPMQPPIYLRYAMWTMASSASRNFRQYTPIFYRRARKYLEKHQTRGFGEGIATLPFVQSWAIIGLYEYGSMFFPRAWISVGIACRMVTLLQLNSIDSNVVGVKRCLPPPKDWIEIEERRRTFWVTLLLDRYASIGTGWPMVLNELDIQTNLPTNDENYEQGVAEETCSVGSAMSPSTCTYIRKMSAFCAKAVITVMIGRIFGHLHRGDAATTEYTPYAPDFFERFRMLNNLVHTFVISLPNTLKQSFDAEQSVQVAQLHMSIHSSLICLHQATIARCQKVAGREQEIENSTNKCLQSASEITRIMQNIAHYETFRFDPYQVFCMYIGARCFIQALRSTPSSVRESSKAQLDFLLTALDNMREDMLIAQSFLLQLEVDMANLLSEDDRAMEGQQQQQRSTSGVTQLNSGESRFSETATTVTATTTSTSPISSTSSNAQGARVGYFGAGAGAGAGGSAAGEAEMQAGVNARPFNILGGTPSERLVSLTGGEVTEMGTRGVEGGVYGANEENAMLLERLKQLEAERERLQKLSAQQQQEQEQAARQQSVLEFLQSRQQQQMVGEYGGKGGGSSAAAAAAVGEFEGQLSGELGFEGGLTEEMKDFLTEELVEIEMGGGGGVQWMGEGIEGMMDVGFSPQMR
ncbi:fungal-specific transcription factor domain-containing protein [Myxozyma melibiosi]|uniref:Fungal-specific transcription factor domain-containing protein n=1 Tax=Myxozyma melibiosi TaxID=54550 RepID=A0ABR1F0D6_9ASCO